MLKKVDIPQSRAAFDDVEYYKSLARLAEQRARDIRRVAALDREQLEKPKAAKEPSRDEYDPEKEHLRRTSIRLQAALDSTRAELKEQKAELNKLKKVYGNLANSRAHRLANAYVHHAMRGSPALWLIIPFRVLALALLHIRRISKIT